MKAQYILTLTEAEDRLTEFFKDYVCPGAAELKVTIVSAVYESSVSTDLNKTWERHKIALIKLVREAIRVHCVEGMENSLPSHKQFVENYFAKLDK